MNYESSDSKLKSFTQLNTWQEAHKLVVSIYEVTKSFSKTEVFGLTSQLRRAAVSVSSNIAEGFSRHSYKDKVQFYYIALGSLTESQNQLLVSRDIGYLKDDTFKKLAEHTVVVSKLLNGMIKKCKSIIHNS